MKSLFLPFGGCFIIHNAGSLIVLFLPWCPVGMGEKWKQKNLPVVSLATPSEWGHSQKKRPLAWPHVATSFGNTLLFPCYPTHKPWPQGEWLDACLQLLII
jgi:hypothetical protein